MIFDFQRALRTSAYVVAVGSALTACGGGNGPQEPESTPSQASNTASTQTAGNQFVASGAPAADASSNAAPVSTVADTSPATPPASADTPETTIASADVSPLGVMPAITTPKATVTPKAARSGAGLNLSFLDPTSTEFPTIDLMKRSGIWLTQCASWLSASCKDFAAGQSAWDTKEEGKLDVDAQGWIRSLPANTDAASKYRYVTTVLSGGGLPDGKYVVRYDGQGTLSYSGAGAKVPALSTAGRDVVQVTSGNGGFFLTINATTPGNYLRNIRVYPPGGACSTDYATYAADATSCGGTKGAYVAFEAFPAGKTWYPPFFTDVKNFRTLRFMDWMRTNTTANANWATRALPTDRTWAGDNGVPLETMIDLANDTGADPWVNIPPYATDDYVHQFARLAHQRLSTSLKLNLEYSNEAWNYAFSATNWMLAQAKATWPAQISQGANVYTLQLNWYAQRLAQVCTIAKQEFGADASRVVCIANSQAALTSVTQQVLDCTYAAPGLGKACGKFFDVVAIAPYFGYYISNPTYRPIVKSWYADADGGLTKLFEEVNGADPSGKAMTAPLSAQTKFLAGARGMSNGWMVTTKAVAASYGLPMWAYEGGQHLVPPMGDTDTTFLSLITNANRDPRMQAAYQQDIADWKAAGGQTFVYYSHVGMPTKYGIWGAKLTLTDSDSPKWKAITQARDGTACWWSGC